MRNRLPRVFATIALVICLFAPARPAAAEEASPPQSGRWIDVDLYALKLTAFDGTTPVRVIPITAGKSGYETPVGTFHVFSRVEDETMSSETLGVPRDAPEGYYLEHVRYVQYFADGGVGLHANYWQPDSVFGKYNTSHGCVSMRLADAAFLWDFAAFGTTVVTHRDATVTVPDVRGQAVADARSALAAAGLAVAEQTVTTADQKAGSVASQQPAPGTSAKRNDVVTLGVAAAPAPKPHVPAPVRPPEGPTAWVPEVAGLPEAEARARIEQAGLSTTYTNYQQESDVAESSSGYFRSVAPGSVLSSSPSAGEQVGRGTKVALAVRKP